MTTDTVSINAEIHQSHGMWTCILKNHPPDFYLRLYSILWHPKGQVDSRFFTVPIINVSISFWLPLSAWFTYKFANKRVWEERWQPDLTAYGSTMSMILSVRVIEQSWPPAIRGRKKMRSVMQDSALKIYNKIGKLQTDWNSSCILIEVRKWTGGNHGKKISWLHSLVRDVYHSDQLCLLTVQRNSTRLSKPKR